MINYGNGLIFPDSWAFGPADPPERERSFDNTADPCVCGHGIFQHPPDPDHLFAWPCRVCECGEFREMPPTQAPDECDCAFRRTCGAPVANSDFLVGFEPSDEVPF